jgi:hypothetical protein
MLPEKIGQETVNFSNPYEYSCIHNIQRKLLGGNDILSPMPGRRASFLVIVRFSLGYLDAAANEKLYFAFDPAIRGNGFNRIRYGIRKWTGYWK